MVRDSQLRLETTNIFSHFLQTESIFKDKDYLSSTSIPQKISYRDEEINQVTNVLAPVLKGFKPNNMFIYGTCGTGKTICTKFIINQLKEIEKNNGHNLRVVYINCKMKKVADTEYRLFAQLLKELGEHVPDTGLPTNVLYRKFFEKVEEMKGIVVIILDEIDALVKKVGDEFLYNFTRMDTELKQSHLTIVGITNDLRFRDSLDQRVKSSLSEEEILFKPYNALQLKSILTERVKDGFREESVSENAINKCAALAAQEHGDARRALDLLRVAGELAERMNNTKVEEIHVDLAEQKIDVDRITETIKAQPSQSQAVLYAIIKLHGKSNSQKKWVDTRLFTGDVYETYKNICISIGTKPLTQRRVSDLIGELDMLGVITSKVVSNGRYGRSKEIVISLSETILSKIEIYLSDRFN